MQPAALSLTHKIKPPSLEPALLKYCMISTILPAALTRKALQRLVLVFSVCPEEPYHELWPHYDRRRYLHIQNEYLEDLQHGTSR